MMVTDNMTFIGFYVPDTVQNVSSVVFVKELATLTDKPTGIHTTEDYFSLTSSSISGGNGGQKSHCSTKSLKRLG